MYTTIGIVVKKRNRGEYDQILTILTKDYGRVDFLSKGVRKGSAKLAGHVALLNLSKVSFVLGKQFKVLTSAVEMENFSSVKKNVSKIQSARRVASLIDRYTLSEEKDEPQ